MRPSLAVTERLVGITEEPRLGALAAAASALLALAAFAAAGASPVTLTKASSGGKASSALESLPLSFAPNRGQTAPEVRYVGRAGNASFFFTQDRIAIALAKGRRSQALHLRFLGANDSARIVPSHRAKGTVNYIGAAERHTSIPTYAALTYRDLWPGIDMIVRGMSGALKYEFRVAPGADPRRIRLGYAGAETVSLSGAGALRVKTRNGVLTDQRPRSHQRTDGTRAPVTSAFSVQGERSYGFALGAYDRSRELVIDPALGYSTYLGGRRIDSASGIAVDDAGSAYVTGQTAPSGFPTTPGAFDTTSGCCMFVAKLSPDGSSLVYSTFLAGSDFDNSAAPDIAVDDAGHAYVTGSGSDGFPTTAGAFDPSFNGSGDAFATKLSADGSALMYSTFLGGQQWERGKGIAVDGSGSAYVTGQTTSPDFPTTSSAYDPTHNGGPDNMDVFVTKVSADGSGIAYSTFVGGTTQDPELFTFVGSDVGEAISVDGAGSAYVVGSTSASDFPTTLGAFDTTYNGTDQQEASADGFVLKLGTMGSSLEYSSYLGGASADGAHDVAVRNGAALVTGFTASGDFPVSPNGVDLTRDGWDAFITNVDPDGSAISYSTFLGGTGAEIGESVVVDRAGGIRVTGLTESEDFPTTPDAFDSTAGNFGDAFYTTLRPDGSALAFSTYLGGSDSGDVGKAISIDGNGSTYVTGETLSRDFPTTAGALDGEYGGGSDGFVTKIEGLGPAPPATLELTPESATNTVDDTHCVTATVRDASGEPTPDIVVRFTVSGSVSASESATTDENGTATLCYQGPELPGADAITAFADTNGDTDQDTGEPSDTASKTWVLPATTPKCKTWEHGSIRARNGDRATFAGFAHSTSSGSPRGFQHYFDHGPADRFKLKSKSIDALLCEGRKATIFGRGRLGHGSTVQFRIEVYDRSWHGRHGDTYRILLSNGYDSGTQRLRSGNVSIR